MIMVKWEIVRTLLFLSLTVFATGLFAPVASAQRATSGLECPASRVVAPGVFVTDGDQVIFQAYLEGGNIDRSLLKYNWTIDGGRIVGGQGTATITVDTTGMGPTGSFLATVDIGGPYLECCFAASHRLYVRRNGPLTKADLFWEWFRSRERQIAEYETSGKSLLDKIQFELQRVDPDLIFEIGPQKEFPSKRDFIVSYKSEKHAPSALADFVALAPALSSLNIVVRNEPR